MPEPVLPDPLDPVAPDAEPLGPLPPEPLSVELHPAKAKITADKITLRLGLVRRLSSARREGAQQAASRTFVSLSLFKAIAAMVVAPKTATRRRKYAVSALGTGPEAALRTGSARRFEPACAPRVPRRASPKRLRTFDVGSTRVPHNASCKSPPRHTRAPEDARLTTSRLRWRANGLQVGPPIISSVDDASATSCSNTVFVDRCRFDTWLWIPVAERTGDSVAR